MTQYCFYHLARRRVDQALPDLLEKALGEGRRIVVRASSAEMAAALDDRLWTYDDASFLPHGGASDDPAAQPIYLTAGGENPNGATLLIALAGVDPAADAGATFERAILLFDGRDEEALQHARAQWTRLKSEGRDVSYWREGDEGQWERAR